MRIQSKLLRRLAYLLGFLILLFGGLWFYPEPEPFQDPDRFVIERPELDPEENAYVVWVEILKEIQTLWSVEEQEALHQALKDPSQAGPIRAALEVLMDDPEEKDVLQRLDQSLALTQAVSPLERPHATLKDESLDFLILSRFYIAQGWLFRHQNQWEEAFASGLKAIHLGRVLQRSHGSSRFYLLGSGIESHGLRLIQKLAAAPEMNDEILLLAVQNSLENLNEILGVKELDPQNILKERFVKILNSEFLDVQDTQQQWRRRACLEALQNEADFLTDLISNEEWFMDQEMTWFQKVAPRMNYFLLYNPTKTGALIGEYRQKLTDFYGRPYIEFAEDFDMQIPSAGEILFSLPSGNAFGNLISSILSPTMQVILMRDIVLRTRLNGTLATLALKRYYIKSAENPNFSIETLHGRVLGAFQSSGYLQNPPLDHFSGEDLRLEWKEKNHAIFSSKGRDMMESEDDLTFPVWFGMDPDLAQGSGGL